MVGPYPSSDHQLYSQLHFVLISHFLKDYLGLHTVPSDRYMLEQLVIKLGKEAFDLLSDNEKHIMKFFIWAGCSCHKDLNTVHGGYTAVTNGGR